MKKIKELLVKYEEIITYVIVGGVTTIVAWGCKFLWNFLFFENTMNPNEMQTTVLSIVNWVSGVAFAFPFNRKYVFKSNGPFFSECIKFWGSRVSTLILDWVITMVLGPLLNIDLRITTLISAVLVTIFNYIFSKLLVFKNKDKKEE